MKILIYFILIVAFLMFYSVSPVSTLAVIFVAIVVYAYFKLRKRNIRTGGRGIFGYGAPIQQNSQVDNITTLLLLKVLMDNDNDSRAYDEKKDKEIKLAKKSEKKVLELLELK